VRRPGRAVENKKEGTELDRLIAEPRSDSRPLLRNGPTLRRNSEMPEKWPVVNRLPISVSCRSAGILAKSPRSRNSPDAIETAEFQTGSQLGWHCGNSVEKMSGTAAGTADGEHRRPDQRDQYDHIEGVTWCRGQIAGGLLARLVLRPSDGCRADRDHPHNGRPAGPHQTRFPTFVHQIDFQFREIRQSLRQSSKHPARLSCRPNQNTHSTSEMERCSRGGGNWHIAETVRTSNPLLCRHSARGSKTNASDACSWFVGWKRPRDWHRHCRLRMAT
jgi:hypothetical protein